MWLLGGLSWGLRRVATFACLTSVVLCRHPRSTLACVAAACLAVCLPSPAYNSLIVVLALDLTFLPVNYFLLSLALIPSTSCTTLGC